MAVLIGFAIASFAFVGLAIFLFRYRGSAARFAGLSAFSLGLGVIVVFILIQATVGSDHPVAGIVFFVSHVVMCMVELLLLGAVLSLYLFMNSFEQVSVIIRTAAEILQMAGYLGMLVFFYLAAENTELARTPWPGGSLRINMTRCINAGLLALGLAGCGYFFSNLLEGGWLARWSSAYVPLSLLLPPAATFAGCLVGVFGLTTGRNLLARRPKA